MEEQKPGKSDQEHNHDNGRSWMSRGHPGQPNGQYVFAKAQTPIGDRLGTHIRGGARAGFGAVRSERHTPREKRRAPAPFRRSRYRRAVSEQRGGGWADQSVNGIPNGIDVRNLVGKEFDRVQRHGDPQDPRMTQHLQGSRQVNHTEALQKAEGGNRRVKVEARRKSGAERKSKGFDRIHGLHTSRSGPLQTLWTSKPFAVALGARAAPFPSAAYDGFQTGEPGPPGEPRFVFV